MHSTTQVCLSHGAHGIGTGLIHIECIPISELGVLVKFGIGGTLMLSKTYNVMNFYSTT